MIITITGKLCSGKSECAKIISSKYGFEYLSTGNIFRNKAESMGYSNILELNKDVEKIKILDKLVDDETVKIGKTRINDNIVFDSRLAWHFIPNSFKVFITVDEDVQAKRLLGSNRSKSEKMGSVEDAKKSLNDRFALENNRYIELYNVDNTNMSNYDFVIDNSNLTIEETADLIFEAYQNFVNSRE